MPLLYVGNSGEAVESLRISSTDEKLLTVWTCGTGPDESRIDSSDHRFKSSLASRVLELDGRLCAKPKSAPHVAQRIR